MYFSESSIIFRKKLDKPSKVEKIVVKTPLDALKTSFSTGRENYSMITHGIFMEN
jgi:hypothetical protein